MCFLGSVLVGRRQQRPAWCKYISPCVCGERHSLHNAFLDIIQVSSEHNYIISCHYAWTSTIRDVPGLAGKSTGLGVGGPAEIPPWQLLST